MLLLPASGKPKTATDRKPFKLTSNDNGSDSRDPDSQFQTQTQTQPQAQAQAQAQAQTQSLVRKIHAKHKMQWEVSQKIDPTQNHGNP